MKRVGDLMIKDVVTVDAKSTVSIVAKLMSDHKIGAVVVLEKNKYVGIFTERDLVNRVFVGIETGNWDSIKIEEVMSRDLLTASTEQLCSDLITTMNDKKHRHVPVVEEGKLVGILSMRDLMSYYVEELEGVAENLRKTTVSRDYLDKANQLLTEKTLQLKKSHEKLKNATMLLCQAEQSRALGEMTAGLAHELNQPLNTAKIICQSIVRDLEKERYDKEYLQHDLHDILGGIDRMAGAIDHMMIFSQQAEEAIENNVDINQMLENSFKFTEQQLKDLNIELVKELSPDLPKVAGNSILLEKVLLSIINNAREAVRKSDKVNKIIKIRTCTDSYRKSIEIEVIDNGVGIPEDIRGKIFQPFFTTTDALSATGKPTEGPGLGLAIARRIIENHQGNIKVESVVGEGTMFTVLIPVLDVAVLEKGYVARVEELTSHYYAGE